MVKDIKKIGITFPFDFPNLYSGSTQRIKADLIGLTQIGCDVIVVFPTKSNNLLLKQDGAKLKVTLRSYFNLQRFQLLPGRLRLLLDEYGQVANPFFYYALRRYLKKADLIFVHFPSSFFASYLMFGKRIPVLYVAHNFEYGLMKQSTRNALMQKFIYFSEKYACSKATKVLCVSEKDKCSIQNCYNLPDGKVTVLPNTVDTDFYSQTQVLYNKVQQRQELGIKPSSFVLLFSGKMDYRPNLEALKFIIDELAPALQQSGQDFEMLVVGAQIPKWCFNLKKQNTSFHSNVPDMRRFFALADTAIVPLNSGSGTRLKILEAFAAKLPVISTSLGCEGIDCQDEEEILIARRNAKDFVKKATILINKPEIREHLVNEAYNLVLTKYSTTAASKYLEELIKKIGNNKNP